MGRSAVGFLTHLDIDRLLGGGSAGARSRQRLTQQGLLPEPRWVHAGRTKVGLFAEPALAPIVVGMKYSDEYKLPLAEAADLHAVLIKTGAFDELVDAITDVLAEDQAAPGQLSLLAKGVADRAPKPYISWHALLERHEAELEAVGLVTCSYAVRVEDADDRIVTVRHERETTRISHSLAMLSAVQGAHVALSRIDVLGRSREFLLPVLYTSDDPLVAGEQAGGDARRSPFAGVVDAVLAGGEERRVPPRFSGDPDTVSRGSDERDSRLAGRFDEGPYRPEVRRSGFRAGGRRSR